MRIAAVGDIHIHETVVEEEQKLFSTVNDEADVLLLCGDITHVGMPKEAEQLKEYLKEVKIPVLAVLGNHDHHHDHADEIKHILSPQVVFLEDQTFVKDGIGFAGTKGFGGGFDNHMLSMFGEKATKDFVTEAVNESLKLENDLRSLDTEKNVVVLHYSPIIDTVRGEPESIFPFLGCSRLAETIDRFPVQLVVHGHAHLGAHHGKTQKGIPVYNCAQYVVAHALSKPYAIFNI